MIRPKRGALFRSPGGPSSCRHAIFTYLHDFDCLVRLERLHAPVYMAGSGHGASCDLKKLQRTDFGLSLHSPVVSTDRFGPRVQALLSEFATLAGSVAGELRLRPKGSQDWSSTRTPEPSAMERIHDAGRSGPMVFGRRSLCVASGDYCGYEARTFAYLAGSLPGARTR